MDGEHDMSNDTTTRFSRLESIYDRLSKVEDRLMSLTVDSATKLSASSIDHIQLVNRTDRIENSLINFDGRLTKLEVKMNIVAYVSGATLLSVLGLIFSFVAHVI